MGLFFETISNINTTSNINNIVLLKIQDIEIREILIVVWGRVPAPRPGGWNSNPNSGKKFRKVNTAFAQQSWFDSKYW